MRLDYINVTTHSESRFVSRLKVDLLIELISKYNIFLLLLPMVFYLSFVAFWKLISTQVRSEPTEQENFGIGGPLLEHRLSSSRRRGEICSKAVEGT